MCSRCRRCLSILVIPSIWLATWCCHIVVVVGVVETLREVGGVGGGRNEAKVVDDGGQEGKRLFVYDVYVSFRQTPLTRLSKRENGRLVIILSNLTKPVNLLFIY